VAYATTAARAFVYEATDVTDVSGGSQPTWPTTVGNTVVDGGVTWTCRSPSDGSWDNASCYLYYITNHAAAAGDVIYIDDGHSEVGIGATLSITCSATFTNPFKLYCVDKATNALSTGAVVASGNQDLRLMGFVYSYGVTFSSGSGQIIFSRLSDSNWILEGNNTTVLSSSSINNIIGYSTAYKCYLTIINGDIALQNTSGATSIQLGCLYFKWFGGKLVSSYGVDNLLACESLGYCHYALIRDVDLTDMGQDATTVCIIDTSTADPWYNVILERCKLPSDAGFTVTDDSWNTPYQGKVILRHCSSANQSYDFYERSYEGTCQDETTIVRTGGASDGTTGISCKMVSSAGCLENMFALESIPFLGWTSSTTEKTFTIEFIHDSATALQDDEIWMELEYPADGTSGLGAIAKSKCAVLGTPADTADSSETWTTTGLTNPNTRKLSVTVTPGKAGPICARVYLAKPSTTVYIDPMITES